MVTSLVSTALRHHLEFSGKAPKLAKPGTLERGARMPEQGGAGEARRAWQDLPAARRYVTSTGRVAILLSLVIHSAFVLPLVFGLGGGTTERTHGSFILDTRVPGPDREVHFVLTGPDRAAPKPTPQEPPEPVAAVTLPTFPPLLP